MSYLAWIFIRSRDSLHVSLQFLDQFLMVSKFKICCQHYKSLHHLKHEVNAIYMLYSMCVIMVTILHILNNWAAYLDTILRRSVAFKFRIFLPNSKVTLHVPFTEKKIPECIALPLLEPDQGCWPQQILLQLDALSERFPPQMDQNLKPKTHTDEMSDYKT